MNLVPLERGSIEFRSNLAVIPPPIMPILNYPIKLGQFFYIPAVVPQLTTNRAQVGKLFKVWSEFSMY